MATTDHDDNDSATLPSEHTVVDDDDKISDFSSVSEMSDAVVEEADDELEGIIPLFESSMIDEDNIQPNAMDNVINQLGIFINQFVDD